MRLLGIDLRRLHVARLRLTRQMKGAAVAVYYLRAIQRFAERRIAGARGCLR